jgi:hypothetical protein
MSDERDEMSADLRALLDSERDRPGPSAADRDALRAGLGALLDGGPGGSGSGGGSGGGGGGGGGATATAAGASTLGKVVAVFVAGAIAGGAAVYAAAPRTVVQTMTTAVAPVVTSAPVVAPSASEMATAELSLPPLPSASASSRIVLTKSAPSTTNRDDDLASERALLERARVALGRGDASGALEALDRHAARHPSGRLSEEREVLAVQALVSAGRKDEAHARDARFHREHPSSAFGSAIDALVR